MALLRRVSEVLARTTTRRGLFGRGTDLAFGALAGAAAGKALSPSSASAGVGTVCAFPGPPCPCSGCNSTAVCAKPCVIHTFWYTSGCWLQGDVTCCDCHCNGLEGINLCGCGTDYQNDPARCPDGTADT